MSYIQRESPQVFFPFWLNYCCLNSVESFFYRYSIKNLTYFFSNISHQDFCLFSWPERHSVGVLPCFYTLLEKPIWSLQPPVHFCSRKTAEVRVLFIPAGGNHTWMSHFCLSFCETSIWMLRIWVSWPSQLKWTLALISFQRTTPMIIPQAMLRPSTAPLLKFESAIKSLLSLLAFRLSHFLILSLVFLTQKVL